ncbi:MAG: hypothetical protein EOO67_21215 [Microbacterium sp.]|nr:MAG: hypothetical protein EOO67_21215 [Microbacterium sp.]
MLKTCAAGSLTALLLLVGTACGDPEEALGNAVSAASCTAAKQAVAPVKDGVRSAVADLGADPAAAQRKLEVLKGAVDGVTATIHGEVKKSLQGVSDDLDTLIAQAKAAADGAVDQKAVNQAQTDLGTAVDDVTEIC